MKILFLYLSAFAGTGGIEKFNRAFMKALEESTKNTSGNFKVLSAYDREADERYISNRIFKGYIKNRWQFSFDAFLSATKTDTIILGHINLAPIGLLIKQLFPNKKIVLIAHGIEVWYKLSFVKKQLLCKADHILAVSQYTKDNLVSNHQVDSNKIYIFPNTLDPLFKVPANFHKPDYLVKRYKLSSSTKVILTIARLSSAEKYKGYDIVMKAIAEVVNILPDTIYIIGGKYDIREKKRIDELIDLLSLQDKVILTGYIPDEELIDHYLLSDLFVMPSKGEGFGIVFIEAMACGLPVIGGNKDGSVDALDHGVLGTLIDPDDLSSVKEAIRKILTSKITNKISLQSEVIKRFGFNSYLKRTRNTLSSIQR